MRRKRCRCCRKLYFPHSQTYRQQKTCDKESCRAWRKRQALKEWRLKNPLYPESCRAKQKLWRQNHSRYWKAWRKTHPGYVQRNGRLQKVRNARNRGVIAKRNEWKEVCLEKSARIRSLRLIAKENEWNGIAFRQIDGICRYLQSQALIAKRNDIDQRL